jgi:hypothetical protein
MNDIPVAMDHRALREIGLHLGRAADAAPTPAPAASCSVADAGGDAAYQEFSSHWNTQLRELARTVDQTAHRATLTALAFQLLDGA